MTLTPYAFWRRQHARHHGSWNNLDRRAASGLDIYSSCMTVAEYGALGRWRRCLVRITNHPIVANLLLPPLYGSPEIAGYEGACIAGVTYRADKVGAQATAQSERIKA